MVEKIIISLSDYLFESSVDWFRDHRSGLKALKLEPATDQFMFYLQFGIFHRNVKVSS